MSQSFQPGDAVRITRSSCKNQVGRFVEASAEYIGQAWIAQLKDKPKALPGRYYFTNQSRAPRKLVPLSWLTPQLETP